MASSAKYEEAREFCMSFVAGSDRHLSQFRETQREILANFVVKPDWGITNLTSPYRNARIYNSKRDKILLKDPETHKLVMTYAAKLMRSIFGDSNHEYLQAKPGGWEDAQKALTTTKLLKYAFGIQGHFRTMLEGVIDMLLFGTSIIESPWKYEEREIPVRTASLEMGIETFSEVRVPVPTYDDVCLRTIDVNDFFPDPSRYRIQDMAGAAKRFRMTADRALAMANAGLYDMAAVKRAIGEASSAGGPMHTSFRTGIDQPDIPGTAHSGFKDMIGYEYLGQIPWTHRKEERGVITVLNNVTVRCDKYPFADPNLPYHALIINPVQGRFFGIAPAEVVRFDQSFADAVKSLLAEAIIRQVHPPIVMDPDAVDPQDIPLLRAWKADSVIPVRGGPSGAGVLPYNANVQNGFVMLQGIKVGIQDASGASGGIQGEPGPDRESATGAQQRLQFAMDRPELAAMVLENECLPPLAQGILRRYQQFLGGVEDLRLRVGELPEPAWIGDIFGDFDVRFFGSRQVASRQMKLQAFDRLISWIQVVPAAQILLPTAQMMEMIVGELLEMPELLPQIGNQADVMRNLMAMQAFGGGGGKPQTAVAGEPPGMLPAQAAGG